MLKASGYCTVIISKESQLPQGKKMPGSSSVRKYFAGNSLNRDVIVL